MGSTHALTASVTLTAQYTNPYQLYVGGVQVTDANRKDILGDGKVTYDPDTCTLHLANVTEPMPGAYSNALIYSQGIHLTITGSANLSKSDGFANGINVRDRSLTLDGDITVVGAMMNASNAAQDVILCGGTIVVESSNYGIRSGRNFYLSEGLTRVAVGAGSLSALYARNQIVIDQTLTVEEYAPESAMMATGELNYHDVKHIVWPGGKPGSVLCGHLSRPPVAGRLKRLPGTRRAAVSSSFVLLQIGRAHV